MRPQTVAAIMAKDVRLGSRNTIFVFAVLSPFVYTFLVSLIFGGMAKDQPKVGFLDMDESRLVPLAKDFEGWVVRMYSDEGALLNAVESGTMDGGVRLVSGFDESLAKGQSPELELKFSGRSYASHRLAIRNTLSKLVRELAGQEVLIEFNNTVLGDGVALSLKDRITPFIFLAVIMVSGYFLTSLGIVEERETRTVTALSVSPTTVTEFITAKALLGYLMAVIATLITFVLNGVTSPAYLALIMPFMMLGGAFAVFLGVILGVSFSNSTELYGTAKGANLLLFAPALVILFPGIPQWIGKIFPTYYIINPILKVSLLGGKWSDVQGDLMILVMITAALGVAALAIANRSKTRL